MEEQELIYVAIMDCEHAVPGFPVLELLERWMARKDVGIARHPPTATIPFLSTRKNDRRGYFPLGPRTP